MSELLISYGKKFESLVELVPLLYAPNPLYAPNKNKTIDTQTEKLLTACKEFNFLLSTIMHTVGKDIDYLDKIALTDKQTLNETLPEKQEEILVLLKNNTKLYEAVEYYDHIINTMSSELINMRDIKQKIDKLITIETYELESEDGDPTGPSGTVLSSITLKGGKKLIKTKRRKHTKRRRPKKRRVGKSSRTR